MSDGISQLMIHLPISSTTISSFNLDTFKMACLIVVLLVATTTADRILYLPPPNSVDDFVRVNISSGDSPIKEVTVAGWVQPTTLDRARAFSFFSYATTASSNMINLGGKGEICSLFAIANIWAKSSVCSSYNIVDGKISPF